MASRAVPSCLQEDISNTMPCLLLVSHVVQPFRMMRVKTRPVMQHRLVGSSGCKAMPERVPGLTASLVNKL